MIIDDYLLNGNEDVFDPDDSSLDLPPLDLPTSDTTWGNSDDTFFEEVMKESQSGERVYHPTFDAKTENADQEWYDYYNNKVKKALEEENYHIKKAQDALHREDQSGYKDHMDRAKSYHSDAESFKRSRDIYKK